MKRKSPGINKILLDQGSKFSSLLESGIKNFGKNTGSAMKKYTSLRPCICGNEVTVEGYNIIRPDRSANGRSGGGICFYIRSNI